MIDGGFYGTVPAKDADQEEGSNGPLFQKVEYVYEMTLKFDFSDKRGELDEIVNSLEEAFSGALLPALFPDECTAADGGSGTGRRQNLRLRKGRLLEEGDGSVIGLSPEPADKIFNDRVCSSESIDQLTTASQTCHAVDGGLTLFVSGRGAEDRSDLVLDTIEGAIGNNGTGLNTIDSSIVSLRLIRVDPTPPFVEETGTTVVVEGKGATTAGSGTALPVVLGAVAGTLALAGGALLALWYRRRRARSNNASSDDEEKGEREAGDDFASEPRPADDDNDPAYDFETIGSSQSRPKQNRRAPPAAEDADTDYDTEIKQVSTDLTSGSADDESAAADDETGDTEEITVDSSSVV